MITNDNHSITSHTKTGKPHFEKGNPEYGMSKSMLMQNLWRDAHQAAKSAATILLMGESGSGKEVLARQIHQWSERHQHNFVAINCSSIPKDLIESELFGHERGAFTGAEHRRTGAFERSNHGTILLDEIGDMPREAQSRLLRVLQEKSISRVGGVDEINLDLRMIAATHQNLTDLISQDVFRRDLFFRLAVVHINIPALRERREDIPDLLATLSRDICSALNRKLVKFTKEATTFLQRQAWPGNVRQLKNLVERMVALHPETVEFTIDHVQANLLDVDCPLDNPLELPSDFRKSRAQHDLLFVAKTIRNRKTLTAAASAMGMTRESLSRLIKRHLTEFPDLEPPYSIKTLHN